MPAPSSRVVIVAELALKSAPLAKTTAPDPVLEAIVMLGAVPPEEANGDEAVTAVTAPLAVLVAVSVMLPALLVTTIPVPAVRVLSANPEPLPISN